jgi:predicted CopG family antitoxin
MHKKLTITVDEEVYEGLHRVIGRRRISGFIEELVRPHVAPVPEKEDYDALAEYERETGLDGDALDWSEALLESLVDAPR